jgi:hypothetical protein
VRAAPALARTPGLTYQTFGGWDFHPLASTTTFGWSLTGPGYVISTAGGTMLKSFIPPHGSVLTEVSLFVNRPDTAFADDVGFFVGIPSAPDFSFYLISVPGTGFQRVDVPFSPITVDGATHEFTLFMNPGSNNRLLMGARVGYKHNPGTTMLPAPIRLLETRPAYQDPSPDQTHPGRQINAGELWDIVITGRVVNGGPIPTGAKAVIGNVTVTNPVADGYLTLFPQGPSRPPSTSSINFSAGATVANGVIVGLSAAGHLAIYASAQTDVIFDAAGYIL